MVSSRGRGCDIKVVFLHTLEAEAVSATFKQLGKSLVLFLPGWLTLSLEIRMTHNEHLVRNPSPVGGGSVWAPNRGAFRSWISEMTSSY